MFAIYCSLKGVSEYTEDGYDRFEKEEPEHVNDSGDRFEGEYEYGAYSFEDKVDATEGCNEPTPTFESHQRYVSKANCNIDFETHLDNYKPTWIKNY